MANNWTYFIRDNVTGEVKIGQSKNPFQRLNEVRTKRPHTELVAIYPDHSLERELHHRFRHLNIEYEWFHNGDEIQEFLSESYEPPIELEESAVDTAEVWIAIGSVLLGASIFFSFGIIYTGVFHIPTMITTVLMAFMGFVSGAVGMIKLEAS